MVTGGAEEEIIGGTSDGDGVGTAIVADLRSEVFEGESVSGVNGVVAEETEFS